MRILFNDEPMKCDDGLHRCRVAREKLRQLAGNGAARINRILPREQCREHQQVSEGDQIPLFVARLSPGQDVTYC
ncbi:sulfur carrier protein ThiS [Enterobacter cloacae subsp. cloacae]|nr:sulfur carrier protein ThiS [Enterobacter cloacae subsp. cloacae]